VPRHLSINKSLVHIGKFTRDKNVYTLTYYRFCRSRVVRRDTKRRFNYGDYLCDNNALAETLIK